MKHFPKRMEPVGSSTDPAATQFSARALPSSLRPPIGRGCPDTEHFPRAHTTGKKLVKLNITFCQSRRNDPVKQQRNPYKSRPRAQAALSQGAPWDPEHSVLRVVVGAAPWSSLQHSARGLGPVCAVLRRVRRIARKSVHSGLFCPEQVLGRCWAGSVPISCQSLAWRKIRGARGNYG